MHTDPMRKLIAISDYCERKYKENRGQDDIEKERESDRETERQRQNVIERSLNLYTIFI